MKQTSISYNIMNFSTIVTADRVVVLDYGRLVEARTHADLMTGEGTYARIIRVQRDVIA